MTDQQNSSFDNEPESQIDSADNKIEAQNDFVTSSDDVSDSNNWNKVAKKAKRREKTKKVLLIIFIVICVLTLVLASTYCILNQLGKKKLLNKNVYISPDANPDAVIYEDGTILYNGVLYEYNQNVTGILFMGIDKSELTESETHGTNGQADTLMLVTIDMESGKTTVTAIPRDTITDVDIYSSSGDFLMTKKTQICLAYAYGDGKTSSCENTVGAVCEFLLGMPINSYLSTDYSLVPKLITTLGSIEVTPNETFEASQSGTTKKFKFEKGVSYQLNKDNALPYLRYRGHNADSSYLRMERQMDFLKTLIAKVIQKTKTDLTYPVTLFNTFSKNTTSNLSTDKITALTSAVFNNRNNIEVEYRKIEGKQIIGEDGYAEFHPDETKLFELVLELFYIPLG